MRDAECEDADGLVVTARLEPPDESPRVFSWLDARWTRDASGRLVLERVEHGEESE